MARLVIFDETVRGIDLPLHPVILGRSRKVDIPIHDQLLSRKHCTIVPQGPALRLVDLKSSNGTFLNGVRIERSDLAFDDIIEIGNTVIVLLDTDTWKRGEGLTRLRNPVKAQELIQRIKKRAVQEKNGTKGALVGGAERGKASLRQRRKLTSSEQAFFEWAEKEWLTKPIARDLLREYISQQAVSLLVRHSPRLKDLLSAVLEKVLVPDAFQGDMEKLKGEIQAALNEALSEKVRPREEPP